MSVSVDDVRFPFRGRTMCHIGTDGRAGPLAMAARLGLSPRRIQEPPKASRLHFDVSLKLKARAIVAGSIQADRYGGVTVPVKAKKGSWNYEGPVGLARDHGRRAGGAGRGA